MEPYQVQQALAQAEMTISEALSEARETATAALRFMDQHPDWVQGVDRSVFERVIAG